MKQGDSNWVVKYVFDEPKWSEAAAAPLWGADLIDPASLGAKQVAIANREGLVLARGAVEVHSRPAETERSARFDYKAAKLAATKLQAIYRGKHLRKKPPSGAKGRAPTDVTAALGKGGAAKPNPKSPQSPSGASKAPPRRRE